MPGSPALLLSLTGSARRRSNLEKFCAYALEAFFLDVHGALRISYDVADDRTRLSMAFYSRKHLVHAVGSDPFDSDVSGSSGRASSLRY